MRKATAALTQLLEKNQFVMWDEFDFALSDGTTLSYTTYDQDIARAGNALFIQDSFDGNGTLLTHNATIGGAWAYGGSDRSSPFDIAYVMSNAILTGSGGLYANTGVDVPFKILNQADITSDFGMAFSANFPQPISDFGAINSIGVGGDGGFKELSPSLPFWVVELESSNGSTDIALFCSFSWGNNEGENVFFSSANVGQQNTDLNVSVEFSNSRSSVTVYVNNSPVFSSSELKFFDSLVNNTFDVRSSSSTTDGFGVMTSASAYIIPSAGNSSAPILKRGAIRSVVGLEVDTLNIEMLCNESIQHANMSLTAFAINGGFDGARLSLNRLYASTWGQAPAGAVNLFSGRVADVEAAATSIKMDVKSNLELLNIKIPRNIYQAGCMHTLYDTNCGANATLFTTSANVTANSTRSLINTDLGLSDGYLNLGVIEFTSGQNNGVTRTIKSYASGIVQCVYPFPYTPVANDTVNVRPGCDKLQATCNEKFNNVIHFRGFPYIPVPETTY